ncbi:hypothetical protein GCM10010384_06500 [Streptomyces djakartensis]|uniref:Flavoprotein n=1 Tax=Streptomyces djakartensis TaxID=68193 RepID=A0ABQ2Z5C1_9ACTN|nr:hypothetical protein GCM10010384_06500 [Streptomyces djakartensis]
MTEPTAPDKKPFLYVVVCAAGVACDVGKLITAAQEANWDVGVIATPQGFGFIDATAIEAQAGYLIRSAWRSPGDPRPLPPADAITVAPPPSTRSTSGPPGSPTPSPWASCARRTAWASRPWHCPT